MFLFDSCDDTGDIRIKAFDVECDAFYDQIVANHTFLLYNVLVYNNADLIFVPECRSAFGNANIPISEQEVLGAMKTMDRKHKAPGVDGFIGEIIGHFILANIKFVTAFFNQCLMNGHFPDAWKVAVIKFINKPGKDKTDIGSYRPIGLLSVFGKLLEKILVDILTFDLEQRRCLVDNQYGFRKQKSTIDG